MKKNKKKVNKKRGISGGAKVAIGAGTAVLAGGAYYLFGPKAKTHQKKALILLGKMKREVASEIKKAKTVSVPLYHKAVDIVSENYAKQYKLHEKDIKAFAQKLKTEWQRVDKTIKNKRA